MPILKYKNTKLLISIKKAVTNKALKQLNQWCTESFFPRGTLKNQVFRCL